jgi:integrase
MANCEIPLCWRVYYGILGREGMRAGEQNLLQVKDLLFKSGEIRLLENKTDSPRDWVAGEDVMIALKLWLDLRDPEPDPEDLLFVDENGAPVVDDDRLAEQLRKFLLASGVTRDWIHNDKFHTKTKLRIRGKLRAHDLRASFNTLNLLRGKTKEWIRQRTGQTDQTIDRYTRNVQGAEDRNLGWFLPLNEAIPEFCQRQPTRAQ